MSIADYIFIRTTFDPVPASSAYYDATNNFYVWGPKSKTWRHCKIKYKPHPKIPYYDETGKFIKKISFGFGGGYGLMRVPYVTITDVPNKNNLTDNFADDVRKCITETVISLKKSGLLRVSGLPISSCKLKTGLSYSVSFGLTFMPYELKNLTEKGFFACSCSSDYAPDWIVKNKKEISSKAVIFTPKGNPCLQF